MYGIYINILSNGIFFSKYPLALSSQGVLLSFFYNQFCNLTVLLVSLRPCYFPAFLSLLASSIPLQALHNCFTSLSFKRIMSRINHALMRSPFDNSINSISSTLFLIISTIRYISLNAIESLHLLTDSFIASLHGRFVNLHSSISSYFSISRHFTL